MLLSTLRVGDNHTAEAFLEPSDEEVLVASELETSSENEGDKDDVEDSQKFPDSEARQQKRLGTRALGPVSDSDSEVSGAPSDDEDAGGWGTSRKDYYDADVIETEADALEEEAEAKRLQRKQLQGMTEADFGFDEAEWLEAGQESDGQEQKGRGKVIREKLPKLEITDAMSPDEKRKILRARYPEFEPLAEEFLTLQPVHDNLKTAATEALVVEERTKRKLNGSVGTVEAFPPFAVVKQSILAAYLASLTMYFALLTSGGDPNGGTPTAMPPEVLQEHSIMETLIQSRDLWQKVKDMNIPDANYLLDEDAQKITAQDAERQSNMNGTQQTLQGLEKKSKKRASRKTKAQKASEAAQLQAEALRAEKSRKTEEELADLSALTAASRNPSKLVSKGSVDDRKGDEGDHSDFGEPTSLTPLEAAQKAKQRKSLRFYTSQIAQKANKRDAAGRDAGGDADIPYKERFRDRQARLTAEAERRGKKTKAPAIDEALGGPSDEEDHTVARELRSGVTREPDRDDRDEDEDDYYDLIASRAASKKAAKASLAAAHAQAAKEGGIVRIVDDETVGEDGKRGISYQIEKNKGITPKRKKDVRNPRVKKRKKFEDKKKKLGSIKPVYKGGEGRGGYGGELTGIKKGLVKSIKL